MKLALALLFAAAAPAAAAEASGAAGVPERFAPLEAPALDEDDLSRLAAGEVLLRDLRTSDGEGIGVMVLGVVDAPPERLWRVMAALPARNESDGAPGS